MKAGVGFAYTKWRYGLYGKDIFLSPLALPTVFGMWKVYRHSTLEPSNVVSWQNESFQQQNDTVQPLIMKQFSNRSGAKAPVVLRYDGVPAACGTWTIRPLGLLGAGQWKKVGNYLRWLSSVLFG